VSEPVSTTSTDQVPRERAAGEVSDVLLNLEHTLARAKKAHKIVAKDGVDTNVELALADAIKDLERVRKRLQQDTYFAGDSLRLL
jgi:predicted O-methyltransferase YrrM